MTMCSRDEDNESDNDQQEQDYRKLTSYVDLFLAGSDKDDSNKLIKGTSGRVDCCGSSRSLYCTECCRIVVPKSSWPSCISQGKLTLPFDLDLILHDRRKSSSGLHAVALLQASKENNKNKNQHATVRLFDVEREEPIPNYGGMENVYLLHPSPGVSKPLESILCKNSKPFRLVVLDCKWTRSSMRFHPNLANLPRIHLSCPPTIKSHFWRWHNAGPGMLSTLEAIYYAAQQTKRMREKVQASDDDDDGFIHIMWLFALQRAYIHRGAIQEGRSLPFSDGGKEEQRALRRQTKPQRLEMRQQARQRAWREAKQQNLDKKNL